MIWGFQYLEGQGRGVGALRNHRPRAVGTGKAPGKVVISERAVEKRKGVLAWRHTYEPGETRTIKFGYTVTYPDGQAVPGF